MNEKVIDGLKPYRTYNLPESREFRVYGRLGTSFGKPLWALLHTAETLVKARKWIRAEIGVHDRINGKVRLVLAKTKISLCQYRTTSPSGKGVSNA